VKNIIIALMLLSVPALAAAMSGHDQVQVAQAYPRNEVIEKRLETLESQQAEIYHTLAEKKAAGLAEKITEKISLSGLIEVEAGFADSESDIALATAQLGFGMEVSEHLGGDLILLFEEGEDFTVDEAAVNISNDAWFSRIGLQYVPFGVFNSHFISDPLTLELGETQEVAILGGYATNLFAFSAFVFNGDAEKAGEDDRIRDWGASLTVTPLEGLEAGASYLSDLADTDAGLLGEDPYADRIAGYSAYAIYGFGPLELSGELLGALEKSDDLGGLKPFTWNLELAYAAAETVEVAAKLEGSDELPEAPEKRYGVAVAWSPVEHVTLAAEYLRAEFEEGDDDDVVTAQLAFEF
jgi:hypothetical protein